MITERQLQQAEARYKRAVGREREKRDELIRQAVAEGWSYRDIGKATGLAHTAVAYIVHGNQRR